MTTSVDNSVAPTESSEGSNAGRYRWLPIIGLVLFPVLKYGLALRLPGMVLPSLVLLVVFALGVYLYFGLARQAHRGGVVPILVAAALGAVATLALCPRGQLAIMVLNVAALTAASIVVGRQIRQGRGSLRLYIYGFVIVALGGILMYASSWPALIEAVRTLGTDWIEQMRNTLQSAGYGAAATAEMVDPMGQFFDSAARLAPSATVMNLVAQFTIGFLWFLARGIEPTGNGLRPFVRWIVPFGLTPVLVAVIVARLVGGEPLKLVADNLLLVLSIFYCVGGLALLEYGLGRIGLPVWARAVTYIMLLLLGLIGYLLTVLLGFIDSFADWRKVKRDEIQLDKA